MSREEFDRVNAKLLGIKDELDVWQKTTVDLFRRYLLDNQGTLSKQKDYIIRPSYHCYRAARWKLLQRNSRACRLTQSAPD